jgi:hypothetical protein
MNREEIEKLNWKELRIEIAIAKGWKWREWEDGARGINCKALRRDENFDYGAYNHNGEIVTTKSLPDWTVDIRDTLDLVSEVDAAGFHWLLRTPFAPGEQYWAGFTPHNTSGWNGRPDYYMSGPTLEIAISRAYLLWKTSGDPTL